MTLRSAFFLTLALVGAQLTHTAQAATVYQCKSPQGETTVSDLPCNAASSTVKQTTVAAPSDTARRPSFYNRMSSRCQGLYDELNSPAIRSMRRETQREVQMAWQSSCEQERAEANRAEWAEQSAKRRSQYQTAQTARATASAPDPDAKKYEQCADMAYGLNQRRARVANSTNPTDKSDLKQLEDVYNSRCSTK